MSLLLFLALAGCTPGEPLETDDDPGTLGQPDPCIELRPASVSFDPIEVRVDPPDTRVVAVVNDCDGDLEIYDIELQNPDYPFELGALESVLVPGGSQADFTVTFDPAMSAYWITKILVGSNDPEIPAATVDLYGEGVAPVVEVYPDSFDFGSPWIGCEVEVPYTIMNLGNADLEVTDFEFATGSSDFSFDPDPATNGELPFFISPGLGLDVFIHYQGLDEFADTAFLTVETNDPFTPETLVTAKGTATLYGRHLDTFASAGGPIDIVITIDRSESMADDTSLVGSNIAALATELHDLGGDWQAAVIGEDDGCVLGPLVTVDSTFTGSAAAAALLVMADQGESLGAAGDHTEAGFTLAEAALDPVNTGSGGCNAGLYRAGARLALVHISDGAEDSAAAWPWYVSLFQGMKSTPSAVVMHGIAGDYPTGCSTADPGKGYYEAAGATGGQFLSICADWGTTLAAAILATPTAAFALTQTPVPDTIEVTVDGIRTTTGWAYDPDVGEVVFEEGHVPAGGSTIEIEYHLLPECSG